MTARDFRQIALSFAETSEKSHMHHPDFRVAGKIFATLGYPDAAWGMVKLTPAQQARFVAEQPDVFVPVKGAWGRSGATSVRLRAVARTTAREALKMAWRNAAPARLAGAMQLP